MQVKAAVASNATVHDVDAPAAAGEAVLSSWTEASGSSAAVAVAATSADAAAAGKRRRAEAGSPARGGGEPAPARKRPKLPLAIAAVIVLALFAVYVVPRFIPHPHDPHEDMVLTSEPAPSSSADTSDAAPPSFGDTTGVSQDPPASSGSFSPGSFSTDELPTLAEFTWLTGDAARGNAPDGATRLVEFGDVEGGWKAYLFGSDTEWLLNARIDSVQGGVAVTLDWYYLRIGGVSGETREDDAPDSLFNGSWSDGLLEALGPGQITLATFWQLDGRQYAIGSIAWPDGTVNTIALVRP